MLMKLLLFVNAEESNLIDGVPLFAKEETANRMKNDRVVNLQADEVNVFIFLCLGFTGRNLSVIL